MKLKTRLSVALVIVTIPTCAMATNGYFLPGAGFRSQGMGGVGIAFGRDSLSTAANPANAVNTGMRGDMGFGIFNPERSARVRDTPGLGGGFGFSGNTESELQYFIVPEMGMSMPLTEKLHLAFAFVGNGGMNTTYPENFFSREQPGFINPDVPGKNVTVGVDMMQLLAPLTLAYKLNDNHAIGASLVMAVTRFRAYGLEAFPLFDNDFTITSDPANFTGRGYDYSYGAGFKLGWLGEFLDDRLTLGLAYGSRTYMTKLDKYRGLFAEQGDFDIPENYGVGIAIKPTKNLVIAADITRINYNDIASVGNPGPTTCTAAPCTDFVQSTVDASKELGNDNGMGFGWKNQTVFKLGVEYGLNSRMLLRAGYNYGKSPIPDSASDSQVTFNLLAPATVEHHYSVGFTYKASDTLEVTGTYMYVAPNSQSSDNQNIIGYGEFGMHQNLFALSLGWVLEPGITEYGEVEVDPYDFSNYYFGMGFGQSNHVDADASVVEGEVAAAGGTSNTMSVNKRSEGWKVFAGYQFTPHFGLEGGYVNLNDTTSTTIVSGLPLDPAPARVVSTTAVDSWFLGATGTLALTENIDLFGKLGAHHWSSHFEVGNNNDRDSLPPPLPLDRNSSDDGVDVYYGVGASYTLIEGLDLRAEWERFKVDEDDVDLITAGFAVRF
jgi:long-chain fatty acid transport protein